jgi:uncharacterized protein (TIGR02246 family)
MRTIRSRSMVFVCALALPLAVACERDPEPEPWPDTAAAPADNDQLPAELQRATDDYIAAWNGDDPAAVAAFYTDDATATVGADTYRGRDEIRMQWIEPNIGALSDLEITPTRTEQRNGDYFSEGTYTHQVDPPDADEFTMTGHYMVTWTRAADGQWRIRSSEIHPDEPPAGQPAG